MGFHFKVILFNVLISIFIRKITLLPSEKGYLLLCLNYDKGYIGNFDLTVNSNKKNFSIEDSSELRKLGYTHQLKGVWNKENAGGCMSELNFYKNPRYFFVIPLIIIYKI